MKRTISIWVTMFLLMFLSDCKKHEINNPFDPECPKELWTPSGFTAVQQGNSVQLSWTQENQHISGFKIDRRVGTGSLSTVGTVAKGSTTWSDNDLKAGQVHEYHLYAYAGSNESNSLTATVTTVLASALTTTAVTIASCSNATSGGNVTSDGGASVTVRGVCWNTAGNPTISDNKTTDGSGTGSFTSNLTGLNEKTTYYVRAYATNSKATSYGSQESFTTPACKTAPSVETTVITKITPVSASGGGNVTSDGGSSVTSRGVCWSTTQNPTTSNNKTSDGTGMGSYASALTGLTANTTYYVRAYAINSIGTGYGKEISFTSGNPATAIFSLIGSASSWKNDIDFTFTNTVGNVSAYKINSLTFKEDEEFKIRANHAWDVSYGYSNLKISGETGNVTSIGTDGNIGVLSERTYEITFTLDWSNNAVSLQMNNLTPSVISVIVSSITSSSAISGGNVINQGSSAVIARGVCWNTSTVPTVNNSKTSNGTGIGSYTSNITGLIPGTTYYVRAYAANGTGTAYGQQIAFTTLPVIIIPATVTTDGVTFLSCNSATLGGNVTNSGNGAISERGVVYATTANPTTANTKVVIGSGTGAFSQTVSGLTALTTYFVRAYGINSAGTAYGPQISFTTPACPPIENISVSTLSAKSPISRGQTLTIDGTIGATKGVTSCSSALYFSLNGTLDTKTDILVRQFTSIFVLGSSSFTATYTIPLTTLAGTYYVFCVADNNNAIAESDETDNVRSIKITVQ